MAFLMRPKKFFHVCKEATLLTSSFIDSRKLVKEIIENLDENMYINSLEVIKNSNFPLELILYEDLKSIEERAH
jgi:ribosomal protein S8